jgi:hypothetical protein
VYTLFQLLLLVPYICNEPSEFYISTVDAKLTLSRNLAKTNSMKALALA